MSDNLISVVIPVYNVEKYLCQCLDSAQAQTYENIEVIMVDDGSTDGSRQICDDYAARDERFSVIHQENSGLSAARNAGLERCSGKYVYFLDSDDWIEKDMLERLVQTADSADSDIVIFEGKSFEDSEKGYHIKQGYTRSKQYEPKSGIELFDELQQNREFKTGVQFCMWKRAFLSEQNIRFYPGILYEDTVFTFVAFCKAAAVAHCHQSLYHRRYRPGSIVTSKLTAKNYQSAETAYRLIVKAAEDAGFLTRKSVTDYIVRMAMRTIDIYSRLSAADKKTCRDSYVKLIGELRGVKGYGDRALYYRTYGKLPWTMYKAVGKLTRRST